MYRESKGLTLIGLIVTIIIMLILAGVVIVVARNAIDAARAEDVRTNMLTIQARARIEADRYRNQMGVDQLPGRTRGDAGVTLPTEIENALEVNSEGYTEYRIFMSEADFQSLGVRIDISRAGAFYVVDFNNNAEVFYSLRNRRSLRLFTF